MPAILNILMARQHTKHPSIQFRNRAHAGLSVFTMRAPWHFNALSAWSNQVCIQIKMTDKDIKAQWHFLKTFDIYACYAFVHSGI